MHRITAKTTIISLCLSGCAAPADIDSGWDTGETETGANDEPERQEPDYEPEGEPPVSDTGVGEPDGDDHPPEPPEPDDDGTGVEPGSDGLELPEEKQTDCQHWLDRVQAAASDMGYEIQVDEPSRVEASHVGASADLTAMCRGRHQAELEIVDADGNYMVLEQFEAGDDDAVGMHFVGEFPAFGTVERELVIFPNATGTSHWEARSKDALAYYFSNLDGTGATYDGNFDAVRDAFAASAAKTHPWRDLHHVTMRASGQYDEIVDAVGIVDAERAVDNAIAYPIPSPATKDHCEDECDDMFDECFKMVLICVAAYHAPTVLVPACIIKAADCIDEAIECREAC